MSSFLYKLFKRKPQTPTEPNQTLKFLVLSSANLASRAIPSPSVVKRIKKVRQQQQKAKDKRNRELEAWRLERELAEAEASKKLKAEQEVAIARIAELEPLAKRLRSSIRIIVRAMKLLLGVH